MTRIALKTFTALLFAEYDAVSPRKEGGEVLFASPCSMENIRTYSRDSSQPADPAEPALDLNTPAVPLPNPGEGGPAFNGSEENVPVVPLPNPGEGGAVFPGDDGNEGGVPVVPLPNPGEGGAVFPGDPIPVTPTVPAIPTTPVIPTIPARPIPVYPRYASVRFLNATFAYPAFRVFVSTVRVVNFLGSGAVSGYSRLPAGYHTVTVTGTDGYIYLQKTLPFESGSRYTVAILEREGGIDLLRIADLCCTPSGNRSNFRVSNLARNSGPLDVLLADGRTIYADVYYKETTAYKRIAPGPYEFIFAGTNQLPSPSYRDIESLDTAFIGMNPVPDTVATVYLNIRTGFNYTIYILQKGLGYNNVNTLIVEDR